jgi:hypothetical protein
MPDKFFAFVCHFLLKLKETAGDCGLSSCRSYPLVSILTSEKYILNGQFVTWKPLIDLLKPCQKPFRSVSTSGY